MSSRGGSWNFCRRGVTTKECVTEVCFFCRVPVILESHMSSLSSCGGGCTPCTPPPPRSTPEQSSTESHSCHYLRYIIVSNYIEFFLLGNGEGDVMYAEEILQPHLKAFPKVSCSTEIHKS